MKKYAIEAKNISKKYSTVRALENLNFNIEKGEVFGIAGPNAAGKSTFLSIIATVVRPSKGDAVIGGYSVVKNPQKVKPMIGYVPQETALYDKLSGYDNLNFWAGIYKISGRRRKKRIEEVAEITGIEQVLRRRVETFSGGMKKRLNIAVALVHNPQILIMDEPTAGVDVISRKLILQSVKQYSRSGRTVVFTSHYMDDMQQVCDRALILDKGKEKASGSIEQLLHRYDAKRISDIMMKLE